MRRYFGPETGCFVAIWLLLLAAGRSRLLRDPGTFWHTVAGQDVLAGELPRVDRFSFTFQGQPWIASNWLSEAIVAALQGALGWDGPLLATVTLLAALYAWLFGRLLRGGLAIVPSALLVGLALAAAAHHFHVRPHLATLVGMPLTAALLCDFESGRAGVRRLWLLVPLFALWTNLHGGVLAAAAMVGLTAGGWTLWRLAGWPSPLVGRRSIGIACLLAACGLALLVNPYGLEMPRTWLRIMALDLPDLIEEHAPLHSASPEGRTTLMLAAVYLVSLCSLRERPRVTWLLPLLWLYLGMGRVRHAPLFALTATVALAEVLPRTRFADWLARRGWLSSRVRQNAGQATSTQARPNSGEFGYGAGVIWRPALVPVLLVAGAIALQAAGVPAPLVGRGWARLDPRRWPLELLPELDRQCELEVLRKGRQGRASPGQGDVNSARLTQPWHPGKSGDSGHARLFNSLGLGGFVAFHAPRWQTFIDDRCELFGGDFLREYARAERDCPELIDRWSAEYDFRVALVKAGSAFDRYLADSLDWTCAGRAEAAALYRRNEAFARLSPP